MPPNNQTRQSNKQNGMKEWLYECCIVELARCQPADLAYTSYANWSNRRRRVVLSNVRFADELTKRGFCHKKIEGCTIYTGFAVVQLGLF